MLNYNVKIGLVPMRRNTTDRPKETFLTWYSAEQRGERFVKYIEDNFTNDNVSFVDSKGLGHKDLIYDDDSAEEIIKRFKDSNVDAVFIINCNFGNEEAAADIAKAIGKPILLWAPLDDEYYAHGMRPTDSQCGPFPLSQKAESGTDSEARLVNQRSWFRAKDGRYMVARMDQESGNYMILPLVADTVPGPQTHGTYIWAEFDDLQKVEDRLLDGPYIHHFVEIEGEFKKEIKEFCKYFPNLKYDDKLD